MTATGTDAFRWLKSALMADIEKRQTLLSVQVVDAETIQVVLSEPHACGVCGKREWLGYVRREATRLRWACWRHPVGEEEGSA